MSTNRFRYCGSVLSGAWERAGSGRSNCSHRPDWISRSIGFAGQETMTTRPQHGDAFPRCLLVRAGYELVESSTKLYSSSILPSSAFRPLGTYPPCSSPVSIAESSPARSAPVWPPDMILRIILSNSSLQRFSVASGSSRSTPCPGVVPNDALASARLK